jgi:hypothetical protein
MSMMKAIINEQTIDPQEFQLSREYKSTAMMNKQKECNYRVASVPKKIRMQ